MISLQCLLERRIFLFKQWLGDFLSFLAKGSNHMHITLKLLLHMNPELPYRLSNSFLQLIWGNCTLHITSSLLGSCDWKYLGLPKPNPAWHPGDNESLPFLLFSVHKALGEKSIRICWKNRSFHPTYPVLISLKFFFQEQRSSKEDTRKAGIWDMCLVNKQENAGQKVITDEKLKLYFLFFFPLYIACL